MISFVFLLWWMQAVRHEQQKQQQEQQQQKEDAAAAALAALQAKARASGPEDLAMLPEQQGGPAAPLPLPPSAVPPSMRPLLLGASSTNTAMINIISSSRMISRWAAVAG